VGEFMRDSDAFTWYMERDPVLRSTVVAVAWLGQSPDWPRLARRVDQATRQIPMFRQRVLEPPGRLSTPRWTGDEDFDLAWHLRRVDAPPPHTTDTVLHLARVASMSAFDRSRPLWEFTLVDHLANGGAALIMKMHHSLTDGVGAMQLAMLLFDAEPDGTPGEPAPAGVAPEHLDTRALVRASLGRRVGGLSSALWGTARFATSSLLHAVRHPLGTARDTLEVARSVGRTVAPATATLSPVMVRRGMTRHLAILEVGVEDLKRAAHHAGGTLNDAFLAGVTAGLAAYHDRHGESPERLRVTLPINIRTPQDPAGGNRITLMRFTVPVSIGDPAQRIRAMGRNCGFARHERSLPLTNAIAAVMNLLPAGVVGSMLKHVDFVASDVPGLTVPVFLAGVPVDGLVSFGPTIGAAVNLTLVSYAGTCSIGVTIDAKAVPDGEVLVDSLREGFEDVLALDKESGPVRVPMPVASTHLTGVPT
jgi:WS/DGAT/MGAT family acyltransferase